VQGLLESTVMAVLAEFGIKAERWRLKKYKKPANH
jgi:hypothetical protein